MRAVFAFLFAASLLSAQKPDPEQLFNQAMAAQQRGDLQAAVSGYESVLKVMPRLIPARANLAAAQLQLGRVDEALANYRTALSEDPKNVQLAVVLANAYVSLSRYHDAISLLQPFEQTHPRDMDVEFLLGEALIDANRQADGLERIEHVANTRNDVNAWMMAALTEIKLAQYAKANASADAALRVDPTAPGAYTLSGMAKAAVGDVLGAKAAYRKAIEQNPSDFDANLRLGTLLLRNDQDPGAAKPYLQHAYQLNSSSLSALFEMAQLAVADRRDAEAITDFEQVVQRAPNLLQPHVRLAVLYARAHRKEDAAREKQIVDRLLAQQQTQDPNALPDDLAPAKFNAPAPSH